FIYFSKIDEHIKFVSDYKQSREYLYNKLREAEARAYQTKSQELYEDHEKEAILKKSPSVPSTIPIDQEKEIASKSTFQKAKQHNDSSNSNQNQQANND